MVSFQVLVNGQVLTGEAADAFAIAMRRGDIPCSVENDRNGQPVFVALELPFYYMLADVGGDLADVVPCGRVGDPAVSLSSLEPSQSI